MSLVYSLLKLVLAFVFTLSSVAKMFDIEGTIRVLSRFRVRGHLKFYAVFLVVSELLVASLILTSMFVRAGAFAAILLLSLFTLVVWVHIRNNDRFSCNCFGTISNKPLGRHTLVRNALLISLAILLLLLQLNVKPLSILHWTIYSGQAFDQPTGDLALLPLFIVVSFLIVLTNSVKALQQRLHDIGEGQVHVSKLTVGQEAPKFSLEDANGRRVTLGSLLHQRKPVILFFTLSSCQGCGLLLRTLMDWHNMYADSFRIVVLADGDYNDNKQTARDFAFDDFLIQENASKFTFFGQVSIDYGVDAWPSSVVVAANGTLLTEAIEGLPDLSFLLERITDSDETLHGGAAWS